MDILLDLGKFLISTAVLGGVLIWLFKEFLKMKFSNEIEKKKGEIDNYFHKEKLKFSKLHEERAFVIKELYSKLYQYHKALKTNLSDVENVDNIDWNFKKQRIDETFEIGKDFTDYYHQNKILLDQKLCDNIEGLEASHLNVMKSITIAHILTSDIDSNLTVEETVNKYIEYEIELKQIINVEIAEIEINLVAEFKKILGVIE